MALDGIVLSSIVAELNDVLVDGRIDKISQPEKDELIISIRNNRTSYKLLLSAQANFPRLHLTNIQKNNPITAPSFCMILRKYLNNARIVKLTQPSYERIVEIRFEHLNELGDLCEKILIIEIMGRHSNIILCDDDKNILDSIKHVSSQMSSVREVFPGKPYYYPPSQDKFSPLDVTDYESFIRILTKPMNIQKAIYSSFNGLSPLIAEEMCYIAGVDSNSSIVEMHRDSLKALYSIFNIIISKIENKAFSPVIYLNEDNDFVDFYVLTLALFKNQPSRSFASISDLLDNYFEKRSSVSRMGQKSVDIRKLVQNNLDRCAKKLDLQIRQLQDTEDRDKLKIKGELIHANLYQINEGQVSAKLFNYYTNETEKIALDPNLSPTQNAQKYYAKYNKKKRTYIALTDQINETKKELSHLESVKYALDFASSEDDLQQIKEELISSGYIKFRKSKAKKQLSQSEPIHYVSSDGFDIFVGKNNFQNEDLWTKVASNNDWWFHAKDMPGSHVIVKANGKELPDRTFEEAAALAAYYSKAKDNPKVDVDYTLKKHLKKPNGAPLGYVIYYTNYSMYVEPSENNLKKMN